MSKRGIATVAVAAAAGLAVAGCGSSSSGGSSGGGLGGATGSSASTSAHSPFVLTYQGGFSGLLAPYTQQEEIGVKAAISVINSEGGADGHKFVLKTVDDGGDPAKAVTAAQKLVAGTKPNAVIPGSITETTIPVLPIYQRAGVLMMSITEAPPANDPAKYPLSYGVNPSVTEMMAGVAAHLKTQGVKSVAVLGENDSTGVIGLQELQSDLKPDGIKVTGSELVAPTATSATAALSSLQSGHPQDLVVEGFTGALAATAFKDRAQLGWFAPTIADDDTSANPIYALGGGASAVKNVVFQSPAYGVENNPVQKTAAFKKFLVALDKLEPKRKYSIELYVASWNLAVILAGAIDQAKSTDTAKVQAALNSLKTSQVPLWYATKNFGFSSTNHFAVYAPGDFSYPAGAPTTANGSLKTSGS